MFPAHSVAMPVLMLASVLFSPGTLDEWEKFKQSEPQSAEMYLFGVGEGYSWANATLESQGQRALFCEPAKLRLLSTNYFEIAAEEISRRQKNHQLPASYTVELALLHGLQRTFPCE